MNKQEANREEKIKLAQKKVEKLKKSILAIGFKIEESETGELKLKK
jgi:hypothetical protein